MSRTTENLHVRGVRTERVVAAVEKRLRAQGLERVPEEERERAQRTEPKLLRIALRRDGPWTTLADPRGFSGFGQAADGDLEGWGRDLSRELDRSVLTVWTWDGESSVIATRWKRGKKRGRIELLRDARRGADGRPRAPAKFLWPWLPKKDRNALIRDGILLAEPAATTGDAELDELLAGFDEADASDGGDESDELMYVGLETSVAALGAAVGMKSPMLDPYDEDARQLLFRPAR